MMEPITYQRITEASNSQTGKFIDLLLSLENQTPNITLTPLANVTDSLPRHTWIILPNTVHVSALHLKNVNRTTMLKVKCKFIYHIRKLASPTGLKKKVIITKLITSWPNERNLTQLDSAKKGGRNSITSRKNHQNLKFSVIPYWSAYRSIQKRRQSRVLCVCVCIRLNKSVEPNIIQNPFSLAQTTTNIWFPSKSLYVWRSQKRSPKTDQTNRRMKIKRTMDKWAQTFKQQQLPDSV